MTKKELKREFQAAVKTANSLGHRVAQLESDTIELNRRNRNLQTKLRQREAQLRCIRNVLVNGEGGAA